MIGMVSAAWAGTGAPSMAPRTAALAIRLKLRRVSTERALSVMRGFLPMECLYRQAMRTFDFHPSFIGIEQTAITLC